jgi:elongation factor Ts
MPQITPQMVKELRDKTGAGMGDCKKALTETDGDMTAAIDYLRKKGAASASKRADRDANEGAIGTMTSDDHKTGVLVAVTSETDFVSRNEGFQNFVQQATKAFINSDADSLDSLLQLKIGDDTIQDLFNELLAKFSERIEIKLAEKIKSDGYLSAYIHAGNKLSVMVEISAPDPNETAASLVRDIAMQIAAMNPLYISRDDVDKEVIDKEVEIYKEMAVKEGKPADIAERIATGKLEKFFQENCLLEQSFVKDSNKLVKDVVAEISKEMGQDVTIKSFRRIFLGE